MINIFASLSLIAALVFSPSAFAGQEDLEYFKQFIYVVDTDNSDPDFPTSSHHFVMTKYDHQIPISATQFITQTFTLYMLDDGTYKAYHRENLHTVGQDWFIPKGCRVLVGNWSVPETKLILTLDGKTLIAADRYIESGQHAMMFTFHQSIISPELKGQTISAGAAQGTAMDDNFCF